MSGSSASGNMRSGATKQILTDLIQILAVLHMAESNKDSSQIRFHCRQARRRKNQYYFCCCCSESPVWRKVKNHVQSKSLSGSGNWLFRRGWTKEGRLLNE